MIQATALNTPSNAGRPLPAASTATAAPHSLPGPVKIATRGLAFYYGDHQALFDNNLDIATNKVTAIIGPSGCGKSTHLRTYNRIFELYRGQRVNGEILLDGQNILDDSCDVLELRRKVGMIFQKPTPFPMSVFDNVAYGLKQHYQISRSQLRERVETALKQAAPSNRRLSGRMLRTSCISPAPPCPVASSSGFASPGPSPSNRRFC